MALFESSTSVRLIFSLLFILLAVSGTKTQDTQPIQGHCAVTYNQKLYIFGGSGDDNPMPSQYFLSLATPFNAQNSVWAAEQQSGSICVSYAACVATQSGQLLVIGGIISESTKNKNTDFNFQIYDFNTSTWIDPSSKLDQGYTGAVYGPRAAFLSPNRLFVYGGRLDVSHSNATSLVPTAMILDLSGSKWTWTNMTRNDGVSRPLLVQFSSDFIF